MIWSIIILFLGYALFIFLLSIGFNLQAIFRVEDTTPSTTFSVIIPFRNEEKYLPQLLTSLKNIDYPTNLFEIILVNDDSTDSSVAIIEQFVKTSSSKNFQLTLNNRVSNSPKKDAITTAIYLAKHDWIVTTDADCLVPNQWLKSINSLIQKKNSTMVVGPVNYQVRSGFLEHFQLLDFMSMQGTTIGGFGLTFPFMCNGANLAYRKELFLKYKGFMGNDQIASGDDVFLFEKFLAQSPKSVYFLKSREAIVTTFPVSTWKELIEQRVRWAAKTGNFQSTAVKLIGLVIFIVNFLLLLLSIYAAFGQITWAVPLSLFLIKFLTDLLLFLPTVRFFQQEKAFLKSYFLSSLFYPFFTVWVIFRVVFTQYTWKGRRFAK